MNDIIGNTVATPYPRPDWNQTDATKPDYIKNKPDSIGSGVKELSPDVDFNKILENGIYIGYAVYEVTKNVPSKIYTEEQIEEQQELGGKASTQYTMLVSMSDKDEEGFQSGFQVIWSYPWCDTKPFVICRFADINMNDSFVDWTEWFDISGGSVDVDLSDYYTSEVVDTLLAEKANESDVNDKIGRINEWLEGHEETLNTHQEQIESKLDSTEFVDFQSYVNEELNDVNESIDGKVNSDEYSDNNEYVQGMLDTLNEQVQTKATMSDVEAYIEETLLGGAW